MDLPFPIETIEFPCISPGSPQKLTRHLRVLVSGTPGPKTPKTGEVGVSDDHDPLSFHGLAMRLTETVARR